MITEVKHQRSTWISQRRFASSGVSSFLRIAFVLILLFLVFGEPVWSELGSRALAGDLYMLDAPPAPVVELVSVEGAFNRSRISNPLKSNNAVLFTPESVSAIWNALGTGLNGTVNAVAVNGSDVFVGGYFTDAGGNPNADHIARWDGTAWHALGAGLNDVVYAITVDGSNVFVGGRFTDAGGESNADNIARWDGAGWHALGSGLNDWVLTIAVSGSDVYVGGYLTNAGGNPDGDYIARWNGATWNAIGAGLNDVVNAIAVSGSNLYVGGRFTDAGGNLNADHIARWDGATWHAFGTGLNSSVYAIAISGSNVYAGGYFTDAGGILTADKIARWDGADWHGLGPGLIDYVEAIAVSGSDVYVGGWFYDAGGNPNADRIARWDGTTWNALGTGLNYTVFAIDVEGSDVYAGGGFTDAGGNPYGDNIARYGVTEYKAFLPIVITCKDLIINGGFEFNFGWDIPITEFTAGYSTSLYRTGARSMRTGILNSSQNTYSYSDFQQKVSIPVGAKASLTTHLYRISEEPGATSSVPLPANFMNMDLKGGIFPEDLQLSGDVQYILILNSDEEWIDTLLWQTKDAPEWTKKVYDLSEYAGETIWLHFGTYNDGNDGVTSMHVDDVSLVVCP